MAKLFIFGIGGTGSRVIKSLTMLLASGVKLNASEVVPIIVDPDRANGDLNRTYEILRLYQQLRGAAEFSHNKFFETKLLTLNELATQNQRTSLLAEDFRAELDGVRNQRFRDFIQYDALPQNDPNRDLVSLLFSEANLNADMEVGFKGNPNIGSVVLNQFKESREFTVFAENFSEGDRVFIIGSLFGGTGAAGLPLILKNIRNAGTETPNYAFLQKARVGALAVLPYFGVAKDDASQIDDQTFMTKTKAALAYYKDNVNAALQALYYIGDADTKKYNNHEGSALQRNDAHFVEMASALAIIDFMAMNDSELTSPVFREFGLDGSLPADIGFSQMAKATLDIVRKPLMQLSLTEAFVRLQLSSSMGRDPWSNAPGKVPVTPQAVGDVQANLQKFLGHFAEWLTELERNKVAFSPFERSVSMKNILQFVKGNPLKRGFFAKNESDTFIEALNQAAKGPIGMLPAQQKLLSVFYDGTQRLVNEEFKL